MTQISLTSPAAVTILLERSKIFSVAPGISSYVTVAIPAESVAATVSAATDFGPYLADREVTLNLFLGTVVHEVKDSAGGGSVSAASIGTALETAPPADLARIQSSVSGAGAALIDASRVDTTLTATEQQALRIVFSGALAADVTFDIGALRKRRTIDTQTSGVGRLLLKFGTSGTAFPVPKNETVEVQ